MSPLFQRVLKAIREFQMARLDAPVYLVIGKERYLALCEEFRDYVDPMKLPPTTNRLEKLLGVTLVVIDAFPNIFQVVGAPWEEAER